MNNNLTIQVDFSELPANFAAEAGDDCTAVIRAQLDNVGLPTEGLVRVVCVEQEGPGGGWPVMNFTFESRTSAEAWLEECGFEEGFEFHAVG